MKQNKNAPFDKYGNSIKFGDILKYVNENYPNKEQPLHGIGVRKGKIVPTIKRGKHYMSWKPLDRPFTSSASRWEIIGNCEKNPELLKP